MLECFMLAQEETGIPAELLVSVAYVESRLEPYAMNIRVRRRIDNILREAGIRFFRKKGKGRYMYSVYPETLSQAREALRIARTFGTMYDYDMGVMQINGSNLPLLKEKGIVSKEEDLFIPCTNIHAGAYILSLCIEKFGFQPKAIDCYNKGFKRARKWSAYVEKVGAVLGKLLEGSSYD